ncbi:Hypothetical protein NAEGRDRAFT_65220 [Naegleria gruberi]|uniref:F-box domain-containing protein n=1 Tax=Naegleria gruberi TaxID=5762 RepID=D2V8N5_NAEGR|nr:uncharacterized protein NAEGRDRAFT_65220 [Naegleria gruberi]EFC46722.1 Hypothetical protein NAEGRDRAFT_65220 [Naegleria gruberi]|eukprot:XP_002679466.1 Hypothetical protein NAEGRDRAFT_65220 [Naegleria gruberi strain NEG-M]
MEQHNSSIILSDDIVNEILSFFDDFKFLIMNCSLISKQWYNIILSTCYHLSCKCNNKLELNGEFLQNISSLEIVKVTLFGDLKLICQLKQLIRLNISNNNIDSEDAKYQWSIKTIN